MRHGGIQTSLIDCRALAHLMIVLQLGEDRRLLHHAAG